MVRERVPRGFTIRGRVLVLIFTSLAIAYVGGRASLSSAAAQSTRRTSTASGGSASVEEKLDAVLANQEKILQRLDAVMEELRVIKVRASMHGAAVAQ